jgi:hypothetical protein
VSAGRLLACSGCRWSLSPVMDAAVRRAISFLPGPQAGRHRRRVVGVVDGTKSAECRLDGGWPWGGDQSPHRPDNGRAAPRGASWCRAQCSPQRREVPGHRSARSDGIPNARAEPGIPPWTDQPLRRPLHTCGRETRPYNPGREPGSAPQPGAALLICRPLPLLAAPARETEADQQGAHLMKETEAVGQASRSYSPLRWPAMPAIAEFQGITLFIYYPPRERTIRI